MTIRVVFFDVFGTLMPYKDLPREVILSHRARLVGLDLSPEQVREGLDRLAQQQKDFSMGGQMGGEDIPRDRTYWERTFARVLSACGVTENTAGYARDMCDAFLDAGDFYLDPEALPTLRQLKERGLRVGVISNAPKGLANTLAAYGLLPELDVVVGSQDVGIEKPDPRIFRIGLEQIKLPASTAAYVGDEYMTDAKAASAVGMLGIFLNRNGFEKRVDTPTIRRLSDLVGPNSPLGT